MRKLICSFTILSALALPFGVFGASGDKNGERDPKADRELAAKIRKAVASDEALQPSSRNIDVTIEKGVLTLKGTVQSDEESQAILGKAESLVIQDTPDDRVASSTPVEIDNELAVAPQH